jgi:iron complex transport system substrate-binding protein
VAEVRRAGEHIGSALEGPSRCGGFFYIPGVETGWKERNMRGLATSPRFKLLLAGLTVVSILGACGSDDPTPTPASRESDIAAEFPVTVEGNNGSLTIEEEPSAIVSLSATATEMLFAIDAGEQVTAVDDQSDYPADAPTTELSGFEPNIEAIAAYEPDLVVASDDLGDLVKSLDKLEIPVLLLSAVRDLEGTYEQIETLGLATGHVDEATALVDDMRAEVQEVTAEVAGSAEGKTYFHELDPTYFTATSSTFIGQVYAVLGLENIADGAPKAESGYLQLSEEYIIDADPDFIFLADTECCDQNLESVSQRPGWDQITAVRTGGVVELQDDVASRWGPRIIDYLRAVADAVAEQAG